MQGIANVISGLGSLFSSTASSTNAQNSGASTGASTGGWRSIISQIFDSLSGTLSNDQTGSGGEAAGSNTNQATTSSASLATFSASSSSIAANVSPLLQLSTATSSTASSVSTSLSGSVPSGSTSSFSSSSGSSGGIYNDINNSNQKIDANFAKAILDAHNVDRAAHGVGALSWDNAAYDYAKNIADNYDCSGILKHTNAPFGENLAAGFADGPSAVKAWYDEGQTYDYSTHNEYNHFTQVVWKSTTKVGCAYKDCLSTGWQKYIVCEYSPAGNYVGQSQANVLPPVN